MAFFSAQDSLTPNDLATLGLLFGELSGKPSDSTLHIHPTQELGENGLPVGTITNVADKDGRQISFKDERSSLASQGWHTDISFEERPANYTLLKMVSLYFPFCKIEKLTSSCNHSQHTLPKTGGDTLFASSYSHYDMLSPALAAFLEVSLTPVAAPQ